VRQRESPLPEERRRFLSHLETLGYHHSALRAIACDLIVIATRLDLSDSDPLRGDRRGGGAALTRALSTSTGRWIERVPQSDDGRRSIIHLRNRVKPSYMSREHIPTSRESTPVLS
jgi:hypothetical protein